MLACWCCYWSQSTTVSQCSVTDRHALQSGTFSILKEIFIVQTLKQRFYYQLLNCWQSVSFLWISNSTWASSVSVSCWDVTLIHWLNIILLSPVVLRLWPRINISCRPVSVKPAVDTQQAGKTSRLLQMKVWTTTPEHYGYCWGILLESLKSQIFLLSILDVMVTSSNSSLTLSHVSSLSFCLQEVFHLQ